ncbi:MAG: hypothetical protein ACJART_002156 [Maribacter sp.]|jgi:hypothetical protein
MIVKEQLPQVALFFVPIILPQVAFILLASETN